MKNWLVEVRSRTDQEGLFPNIWLVRAINDDDAYRIMSERLDGAYCHVFTVKEYDPLLDSNVNIINFGTYSKRYL